MIGFSYSQLYSAMQVWPLKSSPSYLSSINRLIFMGELRLIRDVDLDIFDLNDVETLAPAQTVLAKPQGSTPITFTAPIALNAVSATLTTPWTLDTGVYMVTFSDNELQAVTLTKTATTATWPLPMAAAVTVNAVLAPLFVVEQSLTVVYNGFNRIMTKRSLEFVQLYSQATAGQPKYYCDLDMSSWLMAPATDALATAVKRNYTRRPISIVAQGNTWLGDNLGDVLFAACLMEAEQWLKADDRYADMRTKYSQELLPAARQELISAWGSGPYAPLQAIASIPQPAPAAA